MKHLKTTLILSALLVSTSGMAMDKTAAGAVAGYRDWCRALLRLPGL